MTDPEKLSAGSGAAGDLMKTVAVSDNAGLVEFLMEDNDEGIRAVDFDKTAMTRSSDHRSLIYNANY